MTVSDETTPGIRGLSSARRISGPNSKQRLDLGIVIRRNRLTTGLAVLHHRLDTSRGQGFVV
jgi:hypothetical protein